MVVKELIEKLKMFPEDMEVYDNSWNPITKVIQSTWIHTNYPYDKPDREIVVIE